MLLQWNAGFCKLIMNFTWIERTLWRVAKGSHGPVSLANFDIFHEWMNEWISLICGRWRGEWLPSLRIVQPYGVKNSWIVHFGVKSINLGTVIVLVAIIIFSYGPHSNMRGGRHIVPLGGGGRGQGLFVFVRKRHYYPRVHIFFIIWLD